MTTTCTPYTGSLSPEQQARLLALLWSSLKKVSGVDRVETGEGTKTKTGLLRTLESILLPNRADFQIRYEDDYGEESVENFTTEQDAVTRYEKVIEELQEAASHEGIEYELELIEVLQQHTIAPGRSLPS